MHAENTEVMQLLQMFPLYETLVRASVIGMGIKICVSIVELKQSVLRILDFDTEEREEDKK